MNDSSFRIHRSSLIAVITLAATFAAAWLYQSRRPQPVVLIPTLTGQPEYCLTCHNGIEEISAAHPTDAFGCVRCHGGERLALDEELAHSTLRGGGNPSDLSVVAENCGGTECHAGSVESERDHIARVMTSVQATYAGAIANVYFAFGGHAVARIDDRDFDGAYGFPRGSVQDCPADLERPGVRCKSHQDGREQDDERAPACPRRA